ncbi:MAG: UDP-glucose/GDP-mannose dehydrogenase family protein [Microthrixaceae bacterium]
MGNRIAVVGAGYVGLTSGACLSHLGHDVTCIESDPAKVEMLREGRIPISEPGLAEIVQEGIDNGRLRFTGDMASGVADREFVLLCVPTPQAEDGSADLSFITRAATDLSKHIPSGGIVINKSTVPLGSTHIVADAINRDDVHVVSNPEFLREGHAVSDFLHPERVVIGADDTDIAVRVAGLHLRLAAPVLATDPTSAELIKYASNAFLATKLSFMNSIASLAERAGADIADVVLGIGMDHRIGSNFLQPGPGWGGSCLPKDTSALVHISKTFGYDFSLLQSVIDTNQKQFEVVVEKVREVLEVPLEGAQIAVWGLTFKANTDDVRASPAVEVIKRLQQAGAVIKAYDPGLSATSSRMLEGIDVAADPYDCVKDAQALVVLTEWPEFASMDLDRVATQMASLGVVDTRTTLDRAALERRGFRFRGIGRT